MLEPVSITPKAAEEVLAIMKKKGIPEGYALRVGIKGGGCGAMGFVIGFDKQKEDDLSYSIQEIPMLVSKKHAMYVVGLKVDFHDGADARGFTFLTPEDQEQS